ncbi:MAG: LacI family DNA-binding transcriptional regulator [Bacteroidales bacterium]|jgi:LacI family transcriptional regulator|nr:LacI family DNA-binding transcriptional regulator [Bacteroidales bacterium]
MGKKVKNKDLAARLGLSGTLVSLVLNNKADQHGIRKDTQERVLALARQMGYFDQQKEKNEPAPIEEKPGVLGMIVPTINDPFIYEITPYLQKAFSSIGVGFSIITKDPDDQRYNRLISAFKKFYSGLILVGEAADDYTIRSLKAADYPFVLLEKSVKTVRLNTVCTDNSVGSQLVADHISKLGYKNIIIAAWSKSSGRDTPVIEEIRQALGKNSAINKPIVAEIEPPQSGSVLDITQFEKFMRPPHSAEVILVLHSALVYPLMAALRKRKLRVPQDIALISMEDGIGFDLMFSPVTCLRKQLPAMALKIANMIWTEVKNSGKSKYKRQVNISPELLIRNSCGTI